MNYQLVDLFAGPGGLSEGFGSIGSAHGEPIFSTAIAVESDRFAHRTLVMREFFRIAVREQARRAQTAYWRYLRSPGNEERAAVTSDPLWRRACDLAGTRPLTLGNPLDDEIVEAYLERAGLSDDRPWVLIGGPPCQAYSVVGRSRMRRTNPKAFANDRRHVLYREYLRIISRFRPAVFLMENVRGLLSSTLHDQPIFHQIVDDLRTAGSTNRRDRYQIRSLAVPDATPASRDFVIRAEDFGIPQCRHRVFLLGIRQDLVRQVSQDVGIAYESGHILTPSTPLPSDRLTIFDAIHDLPKLHGITSSASSDEATTIDRVLKSATRAARSDTNAATRDANLAAAGVMKEARRGALTTDLKTQHAPKKPVRALREHYRTESVLNRIGAVPNHQTRSHMQADLARYFYASAWAAARGFSPRLADFPSELLPTHANVRLAVKGVMFADRFRVQVANRAATTITSHISKDGHYFIHYDPAQYRSLTVREAARIQTFPDDYWFEGPRTSQYHQVGNAVPPLLARQIAVVVSRLLRNVT